MNKIFNNFFVFTALGITLGSCSTAYKTVEKGTSKKIYNVKYGDHERNIMDVFLPGNRTPDTPFIIVVHGGAWMFGRKEHIQNLHNFVYKNNFPSASINYRLLAEGITYKTQLEDIDAAVNFIISKADEWHFNPNKIYIIGESAGGHLALLYGYSHPEQIKKIISLSGPADFYSDTYRKSSYYKLSHRTFEKVVGEKYSSEGSDNFKAASPVYNVSNVPTLLFQGNMDFLVNQAQGKALDSVLTAKNIPHRFVYMKGLGHAPRVFNPYARKKLVFPEILKFIKE